MFIRVREFSDLWPSGPIHTFYSYRANFDFLAVRAGCDLFYYPRCFVHRAECPRIFDVVRATNWVRIFKAMFLFSFIAVESYELRQNIRIYWNLKAFPGWWRSRASSSPLPASKPRRPKSRCNAIHVKHRYQARSWRIRHVSQMQSVLHHAGEMLMCRHSTCKSSWIPVPLRQSHAWKSHDGARN